MNRTRLRSLQALLGPVHATILTPDELSELCQLHRDHPTGLPEDVTVLFVRDAVVRRVLAGDRDRHHHHHRARRAHLVRSPS